MSLLLGFDFADLVYPIALLIMAAVTGVKHMLKDKKQPPTKQTTAHPRPPSQQVPRPTQLSGQSRQPAPPQRRAPAPPRQAAAPQRPAVRRVQPQPKHPPRAQPIKPVPRAHASPTQHAAKVADHAAHVANQLREKQLRKLGKLKPQEHLHGPRMPARPPAHRRLPLEFRPRNMQQAFLYSEIFKPPVALREEDYLSTF